MSEQQQLIKETLARLLTDHCESSVVDAAEGGEWAASLWQNLSDTGLTLAGISDTLGGSGGDPADSMLVIWEAAKFAAPVPIAEHFMAARLLEGNGAALTASVATVAEGDFRLSADGVLTGEATGVAFARWCSHVVVIAEANDGLRLVQLPISDATLAEAVNIAGEPRDDLSVDVKVDESLVTTAGGDVRNQLRLLGAATRSVMMAGALESMLEMSVQYSLERNQFGRAISKFQAIQQQLAILAGEVAASTMAAHAASAAVADLDELDIAIAKARIGEAVSECTDIAHQVHGAMGYTMEHSLNHRSRRLWCWRNEYGAERTWQALVGSAMLQGGADGLWGQITARN